MATKPLSLTEGPIASTLVTFTLPILLGNVLQSLNGSINSIWVGKFLGEAALTATSVANAVLFLLIGAIFGISMAATILVAQYLGAQRLDKAKRVVGTSTTFFALVSTAICVFGFLVSEWVLVAMKTPADALPYAVVYLRIIFLAMPFIYMYQFMMAALRGAGDSKTPFAFLILSVVLDIALNPLLIFGWGPIRGLGIAGSALATLIANAVSLAALLFHLYRRKHPLRLRRSELHLLRMDGAVVRTLLFKGVPMGLQLIVISTSGVAMITLVNRFGTDTTAAFGAAFQLWNYIQMPAFAVSAAVSSMVAQNIGARRWDRIGRIAGAGVALCVLISGAVVGLLLLFNEPALSLFLPTDGPAIAIGQHLNRIVAWSFIFFGISVTLFGVIRASGAVIAPLLILLFALWIVRIPLATLLLDRLQADAIWWSFSASSIVSATLAWLFYRFGNWRNARMTEAPRVATAAAGETSEP